MGCFPKSFATFDFNAFNLLFAILIPSISFLGIIGNILTIRVLNTDRNWNNIRNTIMLTVLHTMYLFGTTFGMLFYIPYHLGVVSSVVMDAYNAVYQKPDLLVVTQRVSGLVTLMIASERLLAIYKPFVFRKHCTKKWQSRASLIFVVVSFALHSPELFYRPCLLMNGPPEVNQTKMTSNSSNFSLDSNFGENWNGTAKEEIIKGDNLSTTLTILVEHKGPDLVSSSTSGVVFLEGTTHAVGSPSQHVHTGTEIISQTFAGTVSTRPSSVPPFGIDGPPPMGPEWFTVYVFTLTALFGIIPIILTSIVNFTTSAVLISTRRNRQRLSENLDQFKSTEFRITLSLHIVVLIYLACLLPSFVAFIASYFGISIGSGKSFMQSQQLLIIFLGSINASVNTVVFYTCGTSFRKHFNKMIRWGRKVDHLSSSESKVYMNSVSTVLSQSL